MSPVSLDEKTQSRLVAILAADGVGYSRLMSLDESATVEALHAARQQFTEQTAKYGGRVVDTAGDWVLAIFPTASGAISASVAIQDVLCTQARELPPDRQLLFLRIGLHLSEVLERPDGSVYGDGINIAARIQSVSQPGGTAVSESLRAAVKGKQGIEFIDMGAHELKNIADPVRIFEVRSKKAREALPVLPSSAGLRPSAPLALPDKPSIVVLPFTNMSGDPEQEYFCDGISDDVITELSRFRSLFVIARNSAFTYKGRAVDIRTVASELGVRYVLEGSVRRAGNRIRLTAQLIDALTGSHLWAEKYDRDVTAIFEVQEEVTQRIVVAIAPFIEEAERDKVRRRPDHFGAYEIGVRANVKAYDAFRRFDPLKIDEAIADAKAALAIDPRSVIALFALAFSQFQHITLGSAPDRNAAWEEGMDAANRAIEADRNDCRGYVSKAWLLTFAPQLDRANEAHSRRQRCADRRAQGHPSIGQARSRLGLFDTCADRSLTA